MKKSYGDGIGVGQGQGIYECIECGKEIEEPGPEWVFVIRGKNNRKAYCCSWTCYRKRSVPKKRKVGHPPMLKDSDLFIIRDMRNAGASMADCAKKFGVSLSTIRKYLETREDIFPYG